MLIYKEGVFFNNTKQGRVIYYHQIRVPYFSPTSSKATLFPVNLAWKKLFEETIISRKEANLIWEERQTSITKPVLEWLNSVPYCHIENKSFPGWALPREVCNIFNMSILFFEKDQAMLFKLTWDE